MLETGIKVVDLLEPYTKGGKTGPLRRRGRRQDRAHPGAHPQHREAPRRHLGLRGRGRADPRGERPLARVQGVGDHREDGPDLRADDGAPRGAAPRRPDRPHGCRVLPRRGGAGRAPLHRQHLPVHPGGLRGLGAPRPHAVGRRVPADPRHRDGRAPGADHLHQARLDHVGAGDLRAGRRHHRPRPGDGLRPSGRDHRAVAADLPSSASTPRSTRWPRPPGSSTRASSARSTTAPPARCS